MDAFLTYDAFVLASKSMYVILGLTLLWASFVDVRKRLVPRSSLIVGIVLWIVAVLIGIAQQCCPFLFALGREGVAWIGESIAGGLFAGGCALLCAAILERRSGCMALGGGDVKLFCVLGLFMEPEGGLMVLGLSSILALGWQICRVLAHKALACTVKRLNIKQGENLSQCMDDAAGTQSSLPRSKGSSQCGDGSADKRFLLTQRKSPFQCADGSVGTQLASPSSQSSPTSPTLSYDFLAQSFPFVPFITLATAITSVLL